MMTAYIIIKIIALLSVITVLYKMWYGEDVKNTLIIAVCLLGVVSITSLFVLPSESISYFLLLIFWGVLTIEKRNND